MSQSYLTQFFLNKNGLPEPEAERANMELIQRVLVDQGLADLAQALGASYKLQTQYIGTFAASQL